LTQQQKAYFALTLTSVLWGSTWVASKVAVQHAPGLQVAGIRQLTAGCILVGWFFLKGEKIPRASQFKWLLLMGLLMFVCSNGLATISLKYISSGLSSLIAAMYPLCVVIMEMIFFKNQKINAYTFAGLLLGIGGIALVLYSHAFNVQPPGYGIGIATSVISMLGWSVATLLIARNKMDMNPYNATGWQMLIGSIILLTLSVSTHNYIPLQKIPANTWLAIAYLVSAGSVIAFAAFIYSMKNLEPAIASLYAYMNPIVAILIGAWVVGEHLTLPIIMGSLITLAGVYIVNRSLHREKEQALTTDAEAM
jgi:drug/metabolite transporter (DMT)-like permease